VGERYWPPFVSVAPKLEYAPVQGNRVGITFGVLKLFDLPHEQSHPFGAERVQTLLNGGQVYPFRIRTGESGQPLFTGGIFYDRESNGSLEFTITDTNYPQLLLTHTLSENHVSVESVSVANPAVVTANGHGMIQGQEIMFEDLAGAATELNYSASLKNRYQVRTVVDGNSFEIEDLEETAINGSTLTQGTITAGSVGAPVLLPFTFGAYRHQTGVVRKTSTTSANPHLDVTQKIEEFADGVLTGTTELTSTELFSTMPTSEIISSNANLSAFELSLSGTSKHGTTLSQLMAVLASELGTSANLQKL